MAKPIRNTPTLYGEDARQFLIDIAKLPTSEERQTERKRVQESVNQFLQLIKKLKKSSE